MSIPCRIKISLLREWVCKVVLSNCVCACVCVLWIKVCNTWLIPCLTSELSTCVPLSPGYTAVHCTSCKLVLISCKRTSLQTSCTTEITIRAALANESILQNSEPWNKDWRKRYFAASHTLNHPFAPPNKSGSVLQMFNLSVPRWENPLCALSGFFFRSSLLLWVDLGSAGEQLVPAHHTLA